MLEGQLVIIGDALVQESANPIYLRQAEGSP